MTEVIQPEWEVYNQKTVKAIEEGIKEIPAKKEPEWAKGYEEVSYNIAKEKYTREGENYRKAAEAGYLVIESLVNMPFTESAGMYLSKFFTALRDEGKILANRCPSCQRIILPPRIMCGFCKARVEDKDENWVTLSDKGTVVSYTVTTEREVDRVTGKIVGEYYPTAFIRLDGGDEWSLLAHFLSEPDPAKIHTGLRVQAVWKPKEQRRARMTDIMYFRTLKK